MNKTDPATSLPNDCQRGDMEEGWTSQLQGRTDICPSKAKLDPPSFICRGWVLILPKNSTIILLSWQVFINLVLNKNLHFQLLKNGPYKSPH